MKLSSEKIMEIYSDLPNVLANEEAELSTESNEMLNAECFDHVNNSSESLGSETYECLEVHTKSAKAEQSLVGLFYHAKNKNETKSTAKKMQKFDTLETKALTRTRASRRRNGYVSLNK